jgi:hypothetical protein
MKVPPVFCVEKLDPVLLEDLRDASAVYGSYCYTVAFDDLILKPIHQRVLQGFLSGEKPATRLAACLREQLLSKWSSTRSLGSGRMEAVARALAAIRSTILAIPADQRLEEASPELLAHMVRMFRRLDDCTGVGSTIASKLLAPFRPALFPMWDNPIAEAYGFASNPAGYYQYLNVTQAIARKVRGFWHGRGALEEYLKPHGRQWTAPLAKVLDEWNWVRITRGHVFRPYGAG